MSECLECPADIPTWSWFLVAVAALLLVSLAVAVGVRLSKRSLF